MLLAIHLFFLVCCTPFYLAIKEMSARAFVMYTDASRHKQQIQYLLALFNNASTVINRVLHVINHLFYDIISTPQALTYRFSARSGWRTIGVRPANTYNSTTFVKEGKREREKKKECVVLSLTQWMCFRLDDFCFSKIVKSLCKTSSSNRLQYILIHSPLPSSTLPES